MKFQMSKTTSTLLILQWTSKFNFVSKLWCLDLTDKHTGAQWYNFCPSNDGAQWSLSPLGTRKPNPKLQAQHVHFCSMHVWAASDGNTKPTYRPHLIFGPKLNIWGCDLTQTWYDLEKVSESWSIFKIPEWKRMPFSAIRNRMRS